MKKFSNVLVCKVEDSFASSLPCSFPRWSFVWLLVVLSLSTHSLSAQSGQERLAERDRYMAEERSRLEVVYEHKVIDPALWRVNRVLEILQHTERVSFYQPYSSFQVDSAICQLDFRVTKRREQELEEEYGDRGWNAQKLTKKWGEKSYSEMAFALGTYRYHDPILVKQWELSPDTMTHLGYLCYKAEVDLGGRRWIAWYTPEIPISDGPYKFDGLPGLVLYVQSSKGQHVYRAVAVRQGNTPIMIPLRSNAYDVKRELWHRVVSRMYWNIEQAVAQSGMGAREVDGSPLVPAAKHLFYNPVETDWMNEQERNEWYARYHEEARERYLGESKSSK